MLIALFFISLCCTVSDVDRLLHFLGGVHVSGHFQQAFPVSRSRQHSSACKYTDDAGIS
jgi:hypothetical protein